MAGSPLRQLLNRLHAMQPTGVSDPELLERWLTARDEAAFELLLRRHGPMVLAVCRRLLSRPEDAEDAFQATFLVLVTKAGLIGKRASVGSWLYKIAVRVALRARARSLRHATVSAVDEPANRDRGDGPLWRDVGRVLDEEVKRLPERYRAAFVLTQLEGKSNEEAARECGVPLGTVVSRLARARERLRNRLTRRGVTLSAGLLAAELSRNLAAADVPAALLASTLRAALCGAADQAVTAGCLSLQAAALTKGVLYAMWITKLKLTTAVVFSVFLLGSGGALTYRSVAADDTPGGKTPTPEVKKAGPSIANLPDLIETLSREQSALAKRAVALERELAETRDRLATLQAKLNEFQVKSTPGPAMAAQPQQRSIEPGGVEAERDEIELLQAQLASKRAQLQAAQATLDLATKRQKQYADLHSRGAISVTETLQGDAAVLQGKATVDAAQADLKQAEIRLKQAERRLARMQEHARQVTPAEPDLEQQMRDLEKKFEALRAEMAQLRRQIPSREPRP